MAVFKVKNLRYIDWGLLAIILILISFGLTVIYGLDLAQDNHFLFFKKQLFFAFVGIAFFFFFSGVDYKIFKTYSYWLYLFSLFLLVLVLWTGKTIRGTTGWFSWGGVQFQPVELAKIFLIIVLARFFALKAYEIKTFQFIVLSSVFFIPVFILVMLQPDLGSALILFFIWIGMLLISGIKKKHFLIIFTVLLVLSVAAWFFVLRDYQKDRILTFLNPSSDPLGSGYNVIQATVAVGSGQLLGRGISLGSQSQLHFLPEAHTDFIFSSLAEAFGFVGSTMVLVLYALFFWEIVRKLSFVRDDFAVFLTVGFLIYFISQIVLNIAMNLSMAPVTGLPLPLISYGGSSLVSGLIMLGIVSNILVSAKSGD